MAKTLLHRLFGIGRLPTDRATQLKAEGILVLEEGIAGSVTYRNFRAPGKYANWKRQWFTAAIALTKARIIALRAGSKLIDIPYADERLRQMRLSPDERGDGLLVAFDAGLFHDDRSGTIEYRFRTAETPTILKIVRELTGG